MACYFCYLLLFPYSPVSYYSSYFIRNLLTCLEFFFFFFLLANSRRCLLLPPPLPATILLPWRFGTAWTGYCVLTYRIEYESASSSFNCNPINLSSGLQGADQARRMRRLRAAGSSVYSSDAGGIASPEPCITQLHTASTVPTPNHNQLTACGYPTAQLRSQIQALVIRLIY